MSARTVYNPACHLSISTRDEIKALGIDLDEYTSNIEDALRVRGKNALANRMLSEIEESLAERRERREQQKTMPPRR